MIENRGYFQEKIPSINLPQPKENLTRRQIFTSKIKGVIDENFPEESKKEKWADRRNDILYFLLCREEDIDVEKEDWETVSEKVRGKLKEFKTLSERVQSEVVHGYLKFNYACKHKDGKVSRNEDDGYVSREKHDDELSPESKLIEKEEPEMQSDSKENKIEENKISVETLPVKKTPKERETNKPKKEKLGEVKIAFGNFDSPIPSCSGFFGQDKKFFSPMKALRERGFKFKPGFLHKILQEILDDGDKKINVYLYSTPGLLRGKALGTFGIHKEDKELFLEKAMAKKEKITEIFSRTNVKKIKEKPMKAVKEKQVKVKPVKEIHKAKPKIEEEKPSYVKEVEDLLKGGEITLSAEKIEEIGRWFAEGEKIGFKFNRETKILLIGFHFKSKSEKSVNIEGEGKKPKEFKPRLKKPEVKIKDRKLGRPRFEINIDNISNAVGFNMEEVDDKHQKMIKNFIEEAKQRHFGKETVLNVVKDYLGK